MPTEKAVQGKSARTSPIRERWGTAGNPAIMSYIKHIQQGRQDPITPRFVLGSRKLEKQKQVVKELPYRLDQGLGLGVTNPNGLPEDPVQVRDAQGKRRMHHDSQVISSYGTEELKLRSI